MSDISILSCINNTESLGFIEHNNFLVNCYLDILWLISSDYNYDYIFASIRIIVDCTPLYRKFCFIIYSSVVTCILWILLIIMEGVGFEPTNPWGTGSLIEIFCAEKTYYNLESCAFDLASLSLHQGSSLNPYFIVTLRGS